MSDWPDTELLLTRLRAWLEETRSAAERVEPALAPSNPAPAAAGILAELVGEFTGLRQELKLQTRSARGLQEQAEALLGAFPQALARLDAVQTDSAAIVIRQTQPVVEALAGLDEAFERGLRSLQQAREAANAAAARDVQGELAAAFQKQPAWRRWAARPFFNSLKDRWVTELPSESAGVLDSLAEGYVLIQNRLRKALRDAEVERIRCVGLPVDPELMTVVDAVLDASRRPGTVIEEVRPGYVWKGRILRCAEVRAVREPPAASVASTLLYLDDDPPE